jgi:hypothetical protein
MRENLFAFTVDVESDIPNRVGSFDGLSQITNLLELLRDFNITGTFLVTGEVASRYPDIIKSITAEGHEVGCHGFNHEPLNDLNPEGLNFPHLSFERKKEILCSTTKVVAAASFCQPRSFRCPYLSFNQEIANYLPDLGYTVDTSQWTPAGSKQSIPFFPFSGKPGSILEVPVPSGSAKLSLPRTSMEPGISGFSLRLNGEEVVQRVIRKVIEMEGEDLKRLVLFSCHPWEFVPQPSWSNVLPDHFWWHSNHLLADTRSLLKFLIREIQPHFVTLQQVYELWPSNVAT